MIACGSLDYARKVAQTANYTHLLASTKYVRVLSRLDTEGDRFAGASFGRIVMKVITWDQGFFFRLQNGKAGRRTA